MSADPKQPAWKTALVSLVMTGVLSAAAYFVWVYSNLGARTFAGGTVLTDLRFFVGLLAVFVALTLLDRLIGTIKARWDKQHTGNKG